MQETNLNISHKGEIIVKTKKEDQIGRPFDSFGTDPKGKGLSDIYDVLEQLSQKSLKLFCMLGKNRDFNTNEVVLIRKELSKDEVSALNKGYKQLEDFNIVKRIRYETYLINPDYIIPKTSNLKAIRAKYKEQNTSKSMTIDEILQESANT
ncbi:hypothetical protein B9T24_16580 [Acinetobacter sp. ANC 4654]|uniref:hypothetical protein n=1 Tax=Acinetobacter sp. ANC 4654 TaxID=1977872 RepID=UPI000A341CE1|nr:hypothetical protein [Acinetobacter sp. ANC 4654]OTG89836.1 hypothetical protein B9T24_16580 [Acinetobacter sp. ANC 4654]